MLYYIFYIICVVLVVYIFLYFIYNIFIFIYLYINAIYHNITAVLLHRSSPYIVPRFRSQMNTLRDG